MKLKISPATQNILSHSNGAAPLPHYITSNARPHQPSPPPAKRLIRTGAHVTFAVSVSAHRGMPRGPALPGLTLVPFSDGYDDGFKLEDHPQHYLSEIKRCGSETLRRITAISADQGRPVTCLVHTILLAWAAELARSLQSATVFTIYYHYFNGYGYVVGDCSNEDSSPIELPGLPMLLSSRDIPSLLVSSNIHALWLSKFQEEIEALRQETNPKVLVNTFDALEAEALRAMDKVKVIELDLWFHLLSWMPTIHLILLLE
ncbi:hypothetical protein AAG906_011171 [Vitis piasezkii]